ncbi:MAG: hypothetical protein OXQ28_06395 [Acidobacteriota bacterium]|nr:hypothetical protein [Acidobacteriota bacterium]
MTVVNGRYTAFRIHAANRIPATSSAGAEVQNHHMPPTSVSTRHDIGEHPHRAGPAWHRLFAYNNLPPVPNEQLTTPAVERRYEIAAAALDALRDATSTIADSYAFFQTTALIEAHAKLRHRGIMTTVGDMIEQIDTPCRSNGDDPDTVDALRHNPQSSVPGRTATNVRSRGAGTPEPRASAPSFEQGEPDPDHPKQRAYLPLERLNCSGHGVEPGVRLAGERVDPDIHCANFSPKVLEVRPERRRDASPATPATSATASETVRASRSSLAKATARPPDWCRGGSVEIVSAILVFPSC